MQDNAHEREREEPEDAAAPLFLRMRGDSEVARLRHTAQQKLRRDEYSPRMLRGQPRGLRG